MDTSLWSQTRSFASLLSDSSADGSACTLDGFPPMSGAAQCADAALVTPSSPNRDDHKLVDARTPEPLGAELADSTTVIWNTIRLLMACSTFQTFVRAVDDDERLVAQLRTEARSRFGSDSDSEPYFLRTRCYSPTLGRFLPRDPR